MLLSDTSVQGKSLQRAVSDGAKRLQEGPLKGPSAALDNMSAAARDLKQKVTSEPVPFPWQGLSPLSVGPQDPVP